ncbi:MAG: hypothetical protein COA78_08455 [Blastopirellula sp.]|nr:MAG: hypothetical protein COA78_08455 [Blastopirellula sp.]
MSTEIPSSIHTADTARRQLESLLDDLADLAESGIDQQQFFAELADRAVFAISALGASIWKLGPSNQLVSVHNTDLTKVYPNLNTKQQQLLADQQSLASVIQRNEPTTVRSVHTNNEAGHLIFACPVIVANQTWGILALYHSPNLPQAAQNGYLQLCQALGEIIAHYRSGCILEEHAVSHRQWQNYLNFARSAHRDLDEKKTAYRLANDARNCLDVDRVTIATKQGSRCKVQAMSGIDTVNHRANVVKKLERLIASVIRLDHPLIFTGDTSDLAPQIEQPLNDYLEETPCRILAIFPLREPEDEIQTEDQSIPTRLKPTLGVLVVEQLEATDVEQLVTRSNEIVDHASTALHNARRYGQVPLRPVWQALAFLLSLFAWHRLSTTLKILIPVSAAVTSTFFIPMNFDIELRGQLLPKLERHIYAPANGDVDRVLVQHGDMVGQGETLIQLSSSEFQLDRVEISGELQNAISERESIRIQRIQNRDDSLRDNRNSRRPVRLDQLSADESRLTEKITNLEKQLKLLQQREAELTLNSPIAGQVLSWNIDETLEMRPIQRGQSLLKVADISGPWVLEFDMPDKSSKHVQDAKNSIQEQLSITFQLVNEPGEQYQAKLSEIGKVVDTNQSQDGPVVKLIADFDKAEIDHLHRGLTVIGRVHCGQRSVAYVWTYQLVESVRRRFFW